MPQQMRPVNSAAASVVSSELSGSCDAASNISRAPGGQSAAGCPYNTRGGRNILPSDEAGHDRHAKIANLLKRVLRRAIGWFSIRKQEKGRHSFPLDVKHLLPTLPSSTVLLDRKTMMHCW